MNKSHQDIYFVPLLWAASRTQFIPTKASRFLGKSVSSTLLIRPEIRTTVVRVCITLTYRMLWVPLRTIGQTEGPLILYFVYYCLLLSEESSLHKIKENLFFLSRLNKLALNPLEGETIYRADLQGYIRNRLTIFNISCSRQRKKYLNNKLHTTTGTDSLVELSNQRETILIVSKRSISCKQRTYIHT